MVTWPMSSRDPQRCCEAVRSAILAIAWLLVPYNSHQQYFYFIPTLTLHFNWTFQFLFVKASFWIWNSLDSFQLSSQTVFLWSVPQLASEIMHFCPYSYNHHHQSLSHLRSVPYSYRICYLPSAQETYSRQRPTFQLSANLQPVSHIQNNRTSCKMSTLWSLCLQWSSQSQSVCLLQASLNWNSPTVYPWSSNQCHWITEVVLSLPPWSFCCFRHHRP